MKRIAWIAVLLTTLILSSSPTAVKSEEIALSGFLVDRTISRFGRDFYQYFGVLWREMPISMTEGVNLVIKETIVPRSGTRLVIEIDNQPIYMTQFGRRNTIVKHQVEQALYTVVDNLVRINFNSQNDDLAESGY